MPPKVGQVPGFKGMDNVQVFSQDLSIPRVILNADVKKSGQLKKRSGFTKVFSLTNGHSLYAASKYMLLADGTALSRTDGVTNTVISGAIGVPLEGLFYAEVNGIVYMSNKWWSRALDLATDTQRQWGITPPEQPVLSAGAGNLPPGIYNVCYTQMVGARMSGNGPLAKITLFTEGGIVCSNLPVGGVVWITEPYGEQLLYAGTAATVVALPTTIELLPSLWCQPPPALENIALGLGRIWGSVGEYLYYSMPYGYEWFRVTTDFFYFSSPITMIAPVTGGVFVGFENATLFLDGTTVKEMTEIRVGSGVVKGSLAYADKFGDLKNNSFTMLGNLDSGIPMWLGKYGVFAGMHNGTVIEVTERKLRFDSGTRVASLFRMKEGVPQYLASMTQPNVVGFGDQVTVDVIRNGRVFLGDFEDGNRDFVGIADSVIATIT